MKTYKFSVIVVLILISYELVYIYWLGNLISSHYASRFYYNFPLYTKILYNLNVSLIYANPFLLLGITSVRLLI
jgi:hypothetical protein